MRRATSSGSQPPRRHLEWRRETLRATLWLVPTVLMVMAAVLFAVTYWLDRIAYQGHLHLPSWVDNGSADAARQILTALAAAIITVIGLVFSITIVALTLASTQFGPRILRNFIRDRGTQVTLGTFVATFVFVVLTLGSIAHGTERDFVPHLSITIALGLVLVDVAVLVYFIHHVATSIQLPEVIASIAHDLTAAIDAEAGRRPATEQFEVGLSENEVAHRLSDSGTLVRAAQERLCAVHRLPHPRRHRDAGRRGDPPGASPRPLRRRGLAARRRLAARRHRRSGSGAGGRPCHRCPPHAHTGPLLRDRPARGDSASSVLPGGERHVHRAHLRRLAGRRAVQADGSMGCQPHPSRPARLHPCHRRRDELSAPGRACLRQDPPSRYGHARRHDPPARRAGEDDGVHDDRRPAHRRVGSRPT